MIVTVFLRAGPKPIVRSTSTAQTMSNAASPPLASTPASQIGINSTGMSKGQTATALTSPTPTVTTMIWSPPVSALASQVCIDTSELVENILRHVDVCTLFLAQRVSRQFQDMITGSLSIQRELFLAPATFEQALSANSGTYARYHKALGHRYQDSAVRFVMNLHLFASITSRVFHWQAGLSEAQREHFVSKEEIDKSQSYCRTYLAHPMPATLCFEVLGFTTDSERPQNTQVLG